MNIVVTGGSRGIGLAIVKHFAKNGHAVIFCSRSEEKLATAAMQIAEVAHNAVVLTYACDMSKKNEVDGFAAFIAQEFKHVDILVNNAGFYLPGASYNEPDGYLEQMLATNLYSAYWMTRALLPQMMERKTGRIINISSIAGVEAYANSGAYSISKFAMQGFGKNLREEMKPFGIGVTNIMPGAVLTDAWGAYDGPAERLMPPEDIAQAVYTVANLSSRTVVEDLLLRPQEGDL